MGLTTVISQDEEIEIVGFAATATEAIIEFERLCPQVLLVDEYYDNNLMEAAEKAGIRTIVFSSKSNKMDVFEALATGAKAYC